MKSNSWVSLIAATGFALGIPSCGGSNGAVQSFAKDKGMGQTVAIGTITTSKLWDGCTTTKGYKIEVPTEVVKLYLDGNLTPDSIVSLESKLGRRLAFREETGCSTHSRSGIGNTHLDYYYCTNDFSCLLKKLTSQDTATLKTQVASAKQQAAPAASR